MELTETGQGVFLVGEAAKSWVALQWFHEMVWIVGIVLFCYWIYRVIKRMNEQEEENQR